MNKGEEGGGGGGGGGGGEMCTLFRPLNRTIRKKKMIRLFLRSTNTIECLERDILYKLETILSPPRVAFNCLGMST